MADILAVLRDPDTRDTVVTVAHATAALLSAGATTLDLAGTTADVGDTVLDRLASDDVAGAVVSSAGDGADLWRILTGSTKPVVVVPPGVRCDPGEIRRVLLPMDGATDTAEAVAAVARQLSDGTTVVATHVFDPVTVPAFWDQTAHAPEAWLREFAARNLPAGARLHLRRGQPVTEVLTEAERCAADLIVLGWKQQVGGGHAPLVRSALHGSVPVLLVPARRGPPDVPEGTLGPDGIPSVPRRVGS